MVQLYIKHTDSSYYLLDLEEDTGINYRLTVKDLSDITKIYSPYTQSFTLKATDKNKILCGFVGNEKIQQVNTEKEFDAMIYISGFIFQSGKLTFEESDYEFQDQKEFKTSFASNLTSLTDKLGDLTIQDLFIDINGNFDPLLKTVWNKNILKDRMQSVKNITLANGINFKWGVPFISNNRVWTYNEDDLGIVDNIAYKPTKTVDDVNFINLEEVRPAVTYMTIMKHLLLKIGTPIECPVFEKDEVKDLYAFCNSESLVVPAAAAYPITSYGDATYNRFDVKNQIETAPANPKWIITKELNGTINIVREVSYNTVYWGDGLDISLKFNGLVSLGQSGTNIKVQLRRTSDNVIIDSQDITGDTYKFRIIDIHNGDSMLDSNGELHLRFEILPATLVDWTNITVSTFQKYRHYRKGVIGSRVTSASFSFTTVSSMLSTSLGGNELNLITILPKMKCVDFLKSFFKTFNISVINAGTQDQKMYWLTPSDIQEVNKPYSKRIVDYTNFVDISSLNKKKANQYNQYVFSHFASKYYESVYGNGTKFGELTYPSTPPAKPTKFEVKTDYSIIKQSTTFEHPSGLRTCLAFQNDAPEVLDNGGNRYKSVYEEFTLFYLKPVTLEFTNVSIEYTDTANAALASALEASFKHPVNGKTLAFGAEAEGQDSLYLNYYSSFIESLLRPNAYLSTFNLNLPPNEIFLNFANLNQGESQIPTGFRAQNEIIIGEQRYYLQDASIDLTSGKAKLSVINF